MQDNALMCHNSPFLLAVRLLEEAAQLCSGQPTAQGSGSSPAWPCPSALPPGLITLTPCEGCHTASSAQGSTEQPSGVGPVMTHAGLVHLRTTIASAGSPLLFSII